MRWPKMLAVSEATVTTGNERAFFGRLVRAARNGSYFTSPGEWLYVRIQLVPVRKRRAKKGRRTR